METAEASAAGQSVLAQFGSRARQFTFQNSATQTSLSSSDVNFSDLPSGVWETRLHGSCPECHHFHVSVPLKISRRPGVYNGVRCRKCGHKWFGLGGSSAHASLVSQETLPRSFTLRSVAAAESTPICSDAPSMPVVMSLANSMRSMTAVGSPPLAAVLGTGLASPVVTRHRSQSQTSATGSHSGTAPAPVAASRQNSRLLSPIDCATRGLQSVSEPQSPVFGAQQLQSPVDTTNLGRQRSLKERVRGGINKVAGKFGYELRKIERSKSAPIRNYGAQSNEQAVESTLCRPPVTVSDGPTQPSPSLENGSPHTPLITTSYEGVRVDYRPTPSGNAPSALDIGLRRRELTAQANRRCLCSEDCHCKNACSLNIPGFPLSSLATQYNEQTTFDNPVPTQARAGAVRPRSSFEVAHMDHNDDCIRDYPDNYLCPCSSGTEQHRLSIASTLLSESTVSLDSGVISPNDQNIVDLMTELHRIFPQEAPAPQVQQPVPQTPHLTVFTDFRLNLEDSARIEGSGDNERTPTNMMSEIDYRQQDLTNRSDIDSTAAAIGSNSVRSSCSEPGFVFRRESVASVG
jgi:hypothetical protein